jgi:hypothetical protein
MSVGSSADFTVQNNQTACEYFVPTLPSGTASYSITHICLFLRQSGSPGALNLLVTTANALFQPSTTVLAQLTVYSTALDTNYQSLRIPVTGLSGLNPSQGLCIQVSFNYGGAQWQYERSTLVPPVVGAYSSMNFNGYWWTPSTLNALMMDVYGTVP